MPSDATSIRWRPGGGGPGGGGPGAAADGHGGGLGARGRRPMGTVARGWRRSGRGIWSVAGAAVEALAQQVGVTVVPRVLLDHVDVDPSERYLVAPLGDERIVERVRGDRPPRQFPFESQHRIVLFGASGVRLFEGGVRYVLAPEQVVD